MTDEAEEVKEKSEGVKDFIFKLLPYVLMIALGAGGGIYTAQQKPEWFGLSKSTVAAQAEVDALITQVGKLIALPTDEKPTVATVTDASKVKDQPFFTNAKNEDKVMIYQKAQKAILFRPSENRIIEVGAVNINNQAVQSPAPSASPTSDKTTKATTEPSTSESPTTP
jgi:hypothetical protein